MDNPSLINRVLHIAFVLEKPRDWFIKPTLAIVVINTLYFALESLIFGVVPERVLPQLMLNALVILPFIGFGFAAAASFMKIQHQLAHLALTDVLTGLPNRRAFVDNIKRAFVNGKPGYLLLIDADFFKRVNDTYGHAVGDACLVALAERLRAVIAAEDLIARVGGEEFAAYLPNTDKPRLVAVGKDLTRTLYVPVADIPEPLPLTVSVGAAYANISEPVATALERADVALYHAKKNGRARMMINPQGRRQDAA